MNSTPIVLEMLELLHYIIFSYDYMDQYRKDKVNFTRTRKMKFTDYIIAIIRGTKTGLQSGLNVFFDEYKQNQEECSKQAFSKGRQRIRPEAFEALYRAVVQKFYCDADSATWHGFHLFGIDGSKLNLPCTEELRAAYGAQKTPGEPQVQALVSCLYDLLNGMIVDTRFDACTARERSHAQEMISSFHVPQVREPVFVMDRGYPSAALIETIENAKYKYVMRCSTEFMHAMDVTEEDQTFMHKFVKSKQPIKLRIVKFKLPSGIYEYLVTNIFDPEIKAEDFKWLYQQRWGIGTKYNDLKNTLEIENFTGYSEIAILQDFYATVLLSNMVAVMAFELRDAVKAAHSSSENAYAYKQNIRATISELKRNVIEMLITDSRLQREVLFQKIARRLMRAVCPIREGRSLPRKKKHVTAKFSHNRKRV